MQVLEQRPFVLCIYQLFVTRILGKSGYKPYKTFGIKTLGGMVITGTSASFVSSGTTDSSTLSSVTGGTYGSVHRTYKEDDGGMLCPKCNLQMSRIYSAPGLIFKGGGWGGKP